MINSFTCCPCLVHMYMNVLLILNSDLYPVVHSMNNLLSCINGNQVLILECLSQFLLNQLLMLKHELLMLFIGLKSISEPSNYQTCCIEAIYGLVRIFFHLQCYVTIIFGAAFVTTHLILILKGVLGFWGAIRNCFLRMLFVQLSCFAPKTPKPF